MTQRCFIASLRVGRGASVRVWWPKPERAERILQDRIARCNHARSASSRFGRRRASITTTVFFSRCISCADDDRDVTNRPPRRTRPPYGRDSLRRVRRDDSAVKTSLTLIALTWIACHAPPAHTACKQGAYAADSGDYVVVVSLADPKAPGQRYLFRDGRRGSTADPNAPLTCAADEVTIRKGDGSGERWKPLQFTTTDAQFSSVERSLPDA